MLKLEIDSLEGVDETLAPLYKENEGKFVLQVEGLPDVKGLKQGLERERRDKKELKLELEKFSGLDLEQYHDLQAREASLKDHDPEKIKAMIDKRVADNNKTWEQKYGELTETLSSTKSKLSKVMVSDELRRVGTELGVNGDEAMSDFVSRGSQLFKVNEEGSVVAMKDGELVYGESGVDPLTMREFGKTLSTTATHLFKSSAGGGAENTGNGQARGGTVRSKADLKTPQEKAKYIGEHGRKAFLELPATG